MPRPELKRKGTTNCQKRSKTPSKEGKKPKNQANLAHHKIRLNPQKEEKTQKEKKNRKIEGGKNKNQS